MDFEWDVPGQVRIQTSYGGPYVELAEDATSYHFVKDQDMDEEFFSPTIYITPGDGWYLETAVSTDGEKTYNSGDNQMINVQLYSDSNEKTFKINLSRIEYDGEITIKVINGFRQFSASFNPTGRAIEFTSHEFKVPFSTDHEKSISFGIAGTTDDTRYVKRNGEIVSSEFYGSFRASNISFMDGDVFELNASATPDEVEENVDITISYEGEGANALEMISNQYGTKYMKSSGDEPPTSLDDIVKGTYTRFALNGYDYDVTVTDNGVTHVLDNSECSVISQNMLYSIEDIQTDHAITISANERQYSTTYVSVAIADPEGIIFRAGSYDGEEIDLSTLTSSSTDEWDGVTYNIYSIPVSSKNPKIFFKASEGYYIRDAFYFDEGKRYDDKKVETGSAQNDFGLVFVRGHKIDKNAANVVMYFNGDPESLHLKNAQGEPQTLEDGYSIFYFDPVYDAPFSMTATGSTTLYPYEDNNAVKADENGVYQFTVGTDVADVKTVKIYTGSAPATTTLNVKAHPLAQFELVADKTRIITNHAEDNIHHRNTELKIKPGENASVALDGVELTDKDTEGYHVFTATNAAHTLTVSLVGDDPLEANVEASDARDVYTVSFPYAETAGMAPSYNLDDVKLKSADESYVSTSVKAKKLSDQANTWQFTVTPAPTQTGEYTFSIGEGFFRIHNVDSPAIEKTFSFTAAPAEITVVLDPAADATVESLDEVTITFEGATTAELAENYDISEIALVSTDQSYANIHSQTTIEKEGDNSFKITFGPAPTRNTTYKLTIGTGLFVIDDEPYDEIITADYTLAKPIDEVTYTFEPQGDQIIDSNTQWGINIGVVFNEEATVTVPDAETIASKLTVKFNDETVEYDATGNTGYMVGAEQNMFFIQLGMAYAKKLGTVSIDMAEGLLDFGAGVVSPAISHTWTVVAAKEIEYTVNPDAGNVETPEDLAEFTVVFTNCTDGEVFQESGAELTNGLYDSHRYSQRGTITQVEGAEQPTFKISFSPVPTEIGEYTLNIFEGAITVDNQGSPEITKKYNLLTTGINGIAADANGKYNVMTIDGRIILKDADASQAKQLEKGIYIINGKKALVRK